MNKEKVYCYFHNDDMDGWASSAVVKKKHPDAEFRGYNYEPKFPLVEGYDIVYMVDCSASVKDMKHLMENNKRFVWIDHHAKKIWDTYKELGKDIEGLRDSGGNNSACVLAWQYLFTNEKVPYILKLIQDMDIWNWEYEETDAVNMALFINYKSDRDKLLLFMETWYTGAKELLLGIGADYIKMRQSQIDYLLTTMRTKTFHGHHTGVVNSPVHQSFIGHEMLAQNPDIKIAMIWYASGDLIKVSLRTRGDIDVSGIASLYGGGGHKPASGFTLKTDDISNRDIYVW